MMRKIKSLSLKNSLYVQYILVFMEYLLLFFSLSVMSYSLLPHGLQHAKLHGA